MKGILAPALLLSVSALLVQGQPSLGKSAAVNAASYINPGLPTGSIAQGAMFIVFGNKLGTVSDLGSLTFPLPTSNGLLGTSMKVTVGSTTVDAIMIYTTPTQVAGILPSRTPVGSGTLTLTYNGQSATTSVNVVASSFGVFGQNSAGSGPGIVQNYISETELPL